MDFQTKFALVKPFVVKPNIWDSYHILDVEYQPINLGIGCPDFLPPQHIINALTQAVNNGDVMMHQCSRRLGHPRLVTVLSKLFSPLMNQNIDPYNEIIICAGAFDALHSTIMAHVEEGDEVIIIEPFFECYEPMVINAGGIPRFIPLRFKITDGNPQSSNWVLDFDELQALFNHKTKAIILNTPHNPFGKVFDQAELLQIAELCKKWNVMCISDEVYEWLVYNPKQHIRIASLPEMWDRTITIGSAGKTFCITGWKVGWAIGPRHLMKNLQIERTFIPPTFQQEAVAVGIETELNRINQESCFFKTLANNLKTKRDYLFKIISELGMKPILPDAGIFVVADWTPLETRINLSTENDRWKDMKFTKWFVKNVGVLAMPVSAFYSERHKMLSENLIRFCFIKGDEKLQKTEDVLTIWKAQAAANLA